MLDGSDREKFLSPTYSKFVPECDWNSKISQNVRNLGCFSKKNDGFFQKLELFSKSVKVANLLQIAYQVILLYENIVCTWIESFLQKS